DPGTVHRAHNLLRDAADEGWRGRIVNFRLRFGVPGHRGPVALRCGQGGRAGPYPITGVQGVAFSPYGKLLGIAGPRWPPPAPWPWDVTAGPAGCGSARR